MASVSNVKKIHCRVSEFFVNILRKKKEPKYYELLRGHVSAGSQEIVQYVRKQLRGEELLIFFKRRGNYFTVDDRNYICLKNFHREKNKVFSSDEEDGANKRKSIRKQTRIKKRTKLEILPQKAPSPQRAPCATKLALSSSSSSTSSSSMDELEVRERVLIFFATLVPVGVRLHYTDIKYDRLPNYVKSYLKKTYTTDKIHRFLLAHPEVYSIDDDGVVTLVGETNQDTDISDQEEGICEESPHTVENMQKQENKKKKKVKGRKAAAKPEDVVVTEELVVTLKFFAEILKYDQCKFVNLNSVMGHLSQASSIIRDFMRTNFKGSLFKSFFTRQPKIFKIYGKKVCLADGYEVHLVELDNIMSGQLTVPDVTHDDLGHDDLGAENPSTPEVEPFHMNLRPFNSISPVNDCIYTSYSDDRFVLVYPDNNNSSEMCGDTVVSNVTEKNSNGVSATRSIDTEANGSELSNKSSFSPAPYEQHLVGMTNAKSIAEDNTLPKPNTVCSDMLQAKHYAEDDSGKTSPTSVTNKCTAFDKSEKFGDSEKCHDDNLHTTNPNTILNASPSKKHNLESCTPRKDSVQHSPEINLKEENANKMEASSEIDLYMAEISLNISSGTPENNDFMKSHSVKTKSCRCADSQANICYLKEMLRLFPSNDVSTNNEVESDERSLNFNCVKAIPANPLLTNPLTSKKKLAFKKQLENCNFFPNANACNIPFYERVEISCLLWTLDLFCVEHLQNYTFDQCPEAVEYFKQIIRSINTSCVSLSALKGKMGQADQKICQFFRKKYPGEKFRDFFHECEEFNLNNFNLITVVKPKTPEHSSNSQSLCDLHATYEFDATYCHLYTVLVKFCLLLKRKQGASSDLLAGSFNNLDEEEKVVVKAYKGMTLPSKIENVLTDFPWLFTVANNKWHLVDNAEMYMKLVLKEFVVKKVISHKLIMNDLLAIALGTDIMAEIWDLIEGYAYPKNVSPYLNCIFVHYIYSEISPEVLKETLVSTLKQMLASNVSIMYSDLPSALLKNSSGEIGELMSVCNSRILLQAIVSTDSFVCKRGMIYTNNNNIGEESVLVVKTISADPIELIPRKKRLSLEHDREKSLPEAGLQVGTGFHSEKSQGEKSDVGDVCFSESPTKTEFVQSMPTEFPKLLSIIYDRDSDDISFEEILMYHCSAFARFVCRNELILANGDEVGNATEDILSLSTNDNDNDSDQNKQQISAAAVLDTEKGQHRGTDVPDAKRNMNYSGDSGYKDNITSTLDVDIGLLHGQVEEYKENENAKSNYSHMIDDANESPEVDMADIEREDVCSEDSFTSDVEVGYKDNEDVNINQYQQIDRASEEPPNNDMTIDHHEDTCSKENFTLDVEVELSNVQVEGYEDDDVKNNHYQKIDQAADTPDMTYNDHEDSFTMDVDVGSLHDQVEGYRVDGDVISNHYHEIDPDVDMDGIDYEDACSKDDFTSDVGLLNAQVEGYKDNDDAKSNHDETDWPKDITDVELTNIDHEDIFSEDSFASDVKVGSLHDQVEGYRGDGDVKCNHYHEIGQANDIPDVHMDVDGIEYEDACSKDNFTSNIGLLNAQVEGFKDNEDAKSNHDETDWLTDITDANLTNIEHEDISSEDSFASDVEVGLLHGQVESYEDNGDVKSNHRHKIDQANDIPDVVKTDIESENVHSEDNFSLDAKGELLHISSEGCGDKIVQSHQYQNADEAIGNTVLTEIGNRDHCFKTELNLDVDKAFSSVSIKGHRDNVSIISNQNCDQTTATSEPQFSNGAKTDGFKSEVVIESKSEMKVNEDISMELYVTASSSLDSDKENREGSALLQSIICESNIDTNFDEIKGDVCTNEISNFDQLDYSERYCNGKIYDYSSRKGDTQVTIEPNKMTIVEIKLAEKHESSPGIFEEPLVLRPNGSFEQNELCLEHDKPADGTAECHETVECHEGTSPTNILDFDEFPERAISCDSLVSPENSTSNSSSSNNHLNEENVSTKDLPTAHTVPIIKKHCFSGHVVLLTKDTCIVEVCDGLNKKPVYCAKDLYNPRTVEKLKVPFADLVIDDALYCHVFSPVHSDSIWVACDFGKAPCIDEHFTQLVNSHRESAINHSLFDPSKIEVQTIPRQTAHKLNDVGSQTVSSGPILHSKCLSTFW